MGGRILGKYPSSFSGSQTLNRGRMIPTTPFDSVFQAVSDWMGAEDADFDAILPNRNKFGSMLFNAGDLFE